MKPSSIRAKDSHARRIARGWRKLQLFLSPEAARAMAALELATGEGPTAIINALLCDAGRQLDSSASGITRKS